MGRYLYRYDARKSKSDVKEDRKPEEARRPSQEGKASFSFTKYDRHVQQERRTMASSNNNHNTPNKSLPKQKMPPNPAMAFSRPRAWALNWDGDALQPPARPRPADSRTTGRDQS